MARPPLVAAGRPLRAGMMYRDNRAVTEARQMRDRVGGQAMHERTGHLPEAFHVGPKLLWIRRHEPQIFARARLVLQQRDVVLHRLSGEAGAAIAATVRRARRFVPSGSLSAFEGERAAWFDQVRPSAAVHSPGGLT